MMYQRSESPIGSESEQKTTRQRNEEEPDPGYVARAVADLENEMARTQELIEMLTLRLSPVLRNIPSPTDPSMKEDASPPISNLASTIFNSQRVARDINDNLNELMYRLDL